MILPHLILKGKRQPLCLCIRQREGNLCCSQNLPQNVLNWLVLHRLLEAFCRLRCPGLALDMLVPQVAQMIICTFPILVSSSPFFLCIPIPLLAIVTFYLPTFLCPVSSSLSFLFPPVAHHPPEPLQVRRREID